MSQYQNNPDSEVGAGPWIKAAIFAVAILLLLFFLVTRSSCTRQGGAQSQSDATGAAEQSKTQEEDESVPPKQEEAKSTEEAKEKQTDSKEAGAEKATEEEEPFEPKADAPKTETKSTEAPSPPNSDSPNPIAGGGGSSPAAAEGAGDTGGQSIGGLFVKGEKLGVILDVSGSMSRYLEALRAEIRSRFETSFFLEVEGCIIEPSLFDPSAIPTSPDNPNRRASVMNAIRELVEIEQVDSIYWFCDLQDERTKEGLRELEQLVRGRPGNTPVFHLYIRSTDDKPDENLDQIIRLSEGAFEKRR